MEGSSEEQILELQRQIEVLQTNLEAKEQELEAANNQVRTLRAEIVDQLQAADVNVSTFEHKFIDLLESENDRLYTDNLELKRRFLDLRASARKFKATNAKLKAVVAAQSSAPESSVQAENLALKTQQAELKVELEFEKEQTAEAQQEVERLNQQMAAFRAKWKEMKRQAREDFDVFKEKLTEERRKKEQTEVGRMELELEELRKQRDTDHASFEAQMNELREQLQKETAERERLEGEKTDMQQTIESMDNTAREYSSAQMNFVSSLEAIVGCSDLAGALRKVQELSQLPKQIEELQAKLATAETPATPQGQTYADIVDALQQINQNLSPNVLNLPPNSEVRQLFAALCNMITAALDPNASKLMLLPHVRAVVFQARGFSPK